MTVPHMKVSYLRLVCSHCTISDSGTIPAKQPWRLPRQAAGNYAGYTDVLTKLDRACLEAEHEDEQVVVVLAGMGGVGKSEIVLQFLKRNNHALRKR